MCHHHQHPKYIGPFVVVFPSIHKYSYMLSSGFFLPSLFFNKCIINATPFWIHMSCATAWYKYFRTIIFISGILSSSFVSKLNRICFVHINLYTSVCSVNDIKAGPLPLALGLKCNLVYLYSQPQLHSTVSGKKFNLSTWFQFNIHGGYSQDMVQSRMIDKQEKCLETKAPWVWPIRVCFQIL